MTTIAEYTRFAAQDARGVSPAYERLASAVARDGELIALIDTLPPAKRQPNLLFGVVRLLGGPVEEPLAFCEYVLNHWKTITAQIRKRSTQTNEPARCAVLLPVLAARRSRSRCWRSAPRRGCACTRTGTRTDTATAF